MSSSLGELFTLQSWTAEGLQEGGEGTGGGGGGAFDNDLAAGHACEPGAWLHHGQCPHSPLKHQCHQVSPLRSGHWSPGGGGGGMEEGHA